MIICATLVVVQTMTSRTQPDIGWSVIKHNTGTMSVARTGKPIRPSASAASAAPATAVSRDRPFFLSTPSVTESLPDQCFESTTKTPDGPTTMWSMLA